MMADAKTLIAAEAARPTDPAIMAMAQTIRPLHRGALAVLAYGSTLRDAAPDESLIDLYVLTEDEYGVSGNVLSRLGCRLVPPNVYYAECQLNGKTYRAKYAVLTLDRFAHRVSAATGNPYFWARFCQPCRIVWVADEKAQTRLIDTLHSAATTAFGHARALTTGTARQQWAELFRNTYRTELRPESADRADRVVAANAAYYDNLAAALRDTTPLPAHWPLRRFTGKCLSVLRLIKASFTFQGGADYIAWKIKRHSGVEITVTDWQRRHPLLAGIALLPKLLQKGAIK